ncbi:MAG: nucleotidyltransferase [Parcubacteria group bacterium Gr01-1014_29]|nr:MAG: nucleotidyltransferase [Parcubacteria group bacterium Gr01-1014_29]
MKLQDFEQLHAIFQEHHVALAYVFGSVAQGTEGPLSDIDIAVLFDESVSKELQAEQEFSLVNSIGQVLKKERIDIINLGRIRSPVLKHRAIFLGRPIFAADEHLRVRFEKQVLEVYEDTKHLRHVTHTTMRRQIRERTFGNGALSPREKYIIQKHATR